MAETKVKQRLILRLCVLFIAIISPAILLIKGIYGSFVFTFSIPLIWQVSFLGELLASLGLKKTSIKFSVIGLISGCILGLIGGNLIKILGVAGNVFGRTDKLQLSVGALNISFPLQNELGYRLLTASNSLAGLILYLIFCFFLVGLGEEIFWRGFIQNKISKYFSANLSILITAILFALIHFYIFAILPVKPGVFFLFLIAVSGAVWGYLFKYSNSIWPSVISHGVASFIIWKYYFFSTL